MKNMLKLGFVGGGINSTIGKMHYLASKIDGNWDICSGFLSRDKKINYLTSKKYGIKKDRTYNTLESFIKNEKDKLDAVAIITPTPNHFKILKKLIELNVPIICEKPLLFEIKEKKFLEKKIKNNFFLRTTYNYTGYPLIKKLKYLINKNYFGQIQQVFFEMPQDAFTLETSKYIKLKKWRLKDKKIPNISHDLASHLIHMCLYLFNDKPEKVFCEYFSNSKKGLIDNGYFFVKFSKGINGNFWISKSAVGIRNGYKLRIFGKKRSAEWYQCNPDELIINNTNGSKEVIDSLCIERNIDRKYNRYKVGHPTGFLDAFANCYNDIAGELRKYKKNNKLYKNKNHTEIKNNLLILKFLNKASISNQKKKWVKVDK